VVATGLATALAPRLAGAESEPATVNGLYPLWEQTGELHEAGRAQVGYQHAQVGLGWVQLETQPYLDAYGTANGELKVHVFGGESSDAAVQVGWYHAPAHLERREIGNLHSVSLVNPAPIDLVPLQFAETIFLSSRLQLHAAATALTEYSRDSQNTQLSFGSAGMLEMRASRRWSAMAHAGIEGAPVTVQTHAGLSFAYRVSFLDLRAGYATRYENGTQAGVVLFDGAVVF
jgi:hypothetical protein